MEKRYDHVDLANLMKLFVNHMGLGDYARCEAVKQVDGDFTLHFNLSVKIDRFSLSASDDGSDFVMRKIRGIVDALESGEFLKTIRKDHQLALDRLAKANKNLGDEVDRLKPFETHYSLAFRLQHGKDVPNG